MNVPAVTKFDPDKIKQDIILFGDYSKFTPAQEAEFILWICQQLGLSPVSRPIEFINFQGRRTPYVKRDGTDQLRKMHKVSVTEMTETDRGDVYIVKAKVQDSTGRTDIGTGSVFVGGAKGETLANLLMKAETKAKRRATLSICGLGFLDESEVDELREKDTKPLQAPTFKRAIEANKENEARYQGLLEELVESQTVSEAKAWAKLSEVKIAALGDELRAKLRSDYANHIEFLQNADEPVDESEPAEDEPQTISERAIAARAK